MAENGENQRRIPPRKPEAIMVGVTYILDYPTHFYNGRKVVVTQEVPELGREKMMCWVRVVGTNVTFLTDQWHLAQV